MAVAVKDNICTSDMPTTCSSLMLRGAFRASLLFEPVLISIQTFPPHTTQRLYNFFELQGHKLLEKQTVMSLEWGKRVVVVLNAATSSACTGH